MNPQYMPAYAEGKKEGMALAAGAILKILANYADDHKDEPMPAPSLYNHIVETCGRITRNEPRMVYLVRDRHGGIVKALSFHPTPEQLKSDQWDSNNYISSIEVSDEI